MDKFNELKYFYNTYPYISLVKNKIRLVKKFKTSEKELILLHNSSLISLDNIILKNLNQNITFTNYRYLFLLSEINISEENQKKLMNFIDEFLNFHCNSLNKIPHISYIFKIIPKLTICNYETFILSFKKNIIFELYLLEIIELLGYIGKKDSISLLLDLIKKFPFSRELCFLSIGKIASYKNFPTIKRIYFNDYLAFVLKLLKNKKNLYNDFLFYSLCEIFLVDNGLNGKLQNKLLDTLYFRKDPSFLLPIAIKILNNSELSFKEKQILSKFQKLKFDFLF